MRIGRIDVDDDAQVRDFWSVGKASEEFERPFATVWSLRAQETVLRAEGLPYEIEPYAAFVDDRMVGSVAVEFPMLDNLHLVEIDLNVVPEARRQGIGSALLELAIERVKARDRTTMLSVVSHPTDGQSPYLDFAESHGFSVGLVNKHRALELPVSDDRLDELAAAAAHHHRDYRLVHYDDVRPDDIVGSYAALMSSFLAEAPMGDLDIQEEKWDVDRVRRMEANFKNRGRHECGTVAIDGEGSVVALTDLAADDEQRTFGLQSGTIVSAAHRGHRLGMAVKVANLRAYQQHHPDVAVLHSWNADVNAHMIAINDALGFRVVESLSEVQRVI